MNFFRHSWPRFWKVDAFSPGSFIQRAVAVIVFFGIAHLAGLREYTTFLSGTSASPAMSWQMAAFLGCIYLFLYLSLIILVPISFVAAALIALLNRWRKQR